MIGSGSGLDVANAVYQHGLKVAVIEKGKMGGTCLNRGCVPSKLLIHSADVIETIRRAHLFGLKVDGFSVDFQKIVERVNNIVDSESNEIRNAFEGTENPKLFPNKSRFVGEKVISVRDDDNVKGLEESGYITSDEALRLKDQPRVLTIIGGGYIACELAHFFGSLGTTINIIQKGSFLIPNEDIEISQKFTEIFAKKYNVYLGCNAESVSKKTIKDGINSNLTFHLVAKNPAGKSIELRSDQLLVAVGRVPNSDTLDLEASGVKTNKKGFIITDRYLETNVKGIFALGDAIGHYLFKHNANHEAQYAYHNILHSDDKIPVSYAAMPHAIFSSPQIAGVGFTEQELKEGKKIEYQKSVYPYIGTAMGQALEDRDGFAKFLVDKKNRKILGCHIIGTDASTLIHEVIVAMKAGNGTIDNILKSIHIHPALSEVIARAADQIK